MLLVMVIYRLSFTFTKKCFWQSFSWNILGNPFNQLSQQNSRNKQAFVLNYISELSLRHSHTVLFPISNSWVMLLFGIFWLLAHTVVSGSLWIFDRKPTRVPSPYPLSSHLSVPSSLRPLISLEPVLGHEQGRMQRGHFLSTVNSQRQRWGADVGSWFGTCIAGSFNSHHTTLPQWSFDHSSF